MQYVSAEYSSPIPNIPSLYVHTSLSILRLELTVIYNISATNLNKSKYSLGCSILENVVSMSPLPSLIIKANNYLVLTLIYLTIASYCYLFLPLLGLLSNGMEITSTQLSNSIKAFREFQPPLYLFQSLGVYLIQLGSAWLSV